MAVTKADLAEELIQKCYMDRNDAKLFVDNVFDAMREILSSGQSLKVSGFGNFDLRTKNARPGRNPKTGEDVIICARRVVTFHVGQKLKDKVADFQGTPEE